MGCDWVLPPGHTQRSINSHCNIPMPSQQLWVLPAGSSERPISDLACIQCIGSTFRLWRPEQVLPRGHKRYKCSMPTTSFLHPSKEGLCFETVKDHTRKKKKKKKEGTLIHCVPIRKYLSLGIYKQKRSIWVMVSVLTKYKQCTTNIWWGTMAVSYGEYYLVG